MVVAVEAPIEEGMVLPSRHVVDMDILPLLQRAKDGVVRETVDIEDIMIGTIDHVLEIETIIGGKEIVVRCQEEEVVVSTIEEEIVEGGDKYLKILVQLYVSCH
jgi:hypothetical protein